MPQRVEAAFVFGSLGNLPEALTEGWSVEDDYAWAVGTESRLVLPLPGDDAERLLRLTVQPLINKGVCDAQHLAVDTAQGPLASFSLVARTTIDLPLPIALTRDSDSIELILRHPDALRPSDFKPTDDRRLLSICFLSGTMIRLSDDTPDHAAAAAPACHLIVAGGYLAQHCAEAIAALPSLRGRVACHVVRTDPGRGALPPPAGVMHAAALCWEQADSGQSAGWTALRRDLPADCEIRRFAVPRMTTLWPFLGTDPRLSREGSLYPGGRYPFGDRVGASLANLSLTDDVMLLSYMGMTEAGMPDLDVLLAADRAAWRDIDASCDVKLGDFLVENFRRYRLFFAPAYPAGDLLRHMLGQLLAGSPIEALCDPATLRQELDFMLTGYLGRREELPIHPLLAQRLGLAWWHPGMRYRWQSNRWTFEDYALRYIRWTPWRP